jgi:hypothetical protein
MTIAARCSRSDEVDEWYPFFPRCMSLFMAPNGNAAAIASCLLLGEEQT